MPSSRTPHWTAPAASPAPRHLLSNAASTLRLVRPSHTFCVRQSRPECLHTSQFTHVVCAKEWLVPHRPLLSLRPGPGAILILYPLRQHSTYHPLLSVVYVCVCFHLVGASLSPYFFRTHFSAFRSSAKLGVTPLVSHRPPPLPPVQLGYLVSSKPCLNCCLPAISLTFQ